MGQDTRKRIAINQDVPEESKRMIFFRIIGKSILNFFKKILSQGQKRIPKKLKSALISAVKKREKNLKKGLLKQTSIKAQTIDYGNLEQQPEQQHNNLSSDVQKITRDTGARVFKAALSADAKSGDTINHDNFEQHCEKHRHFSHSLQPRGDAQPEKNTQSVQIDHASKETVNLDRKQTNKPRGVERAN